MQSLIMAFPHTISSCMSYGQKVWQITEVVVGNTEGVVDVLLNLLEILIHYTFM